MPVTPSQIPEYCSSQSEANKWVEELDREFISQKNKNLLSRDYYHGGCFQIIIAGYITTDQVKRNIEQLYRNVGWEKVECMNSSDNEERSGLISLRLWDKEDTRKSEVFTYQRNY